MKKVIEHLENEQKCLDSNRIMNRSFSSKTFNLSLEKVKLK